MLVLAVPDSATQHRMVLVHKPDRRWQDTSVSIYPKPYVEFKIQTDPRGWTMNRSVQDGRAAKKQYGGLSAAELPPETLYAGETIMYQTMGMEVGDLRGKRITKVLAINGKQDYPLILDNEELITQTRLLKRQTDVSGTKLGDAFVKWRNLHSLTLVDGAVEGVTRSSILNQSLRYVVGASFASIREGHTIVSARSGFTMSELALVSEAFPKPQSTDENDPGIPVANAMDADTGPHKYVVIEISISEARDRTVLRQVTRMLWKLTQALTRLALASPILVVSTWSFVVRVAATGTTTVQARELPMTLCPFSNSSLEVKGSLINGSCQ